MEMTNSIEAYDNWATYYDLLYQHRDIGDTDFYISEAVDIDGSVLEIGCGTGRIYLELLENNIDADGIDISHEMLSTLRKKADKRGLDPSVSQGDMTDFDLDRAYDLIIIPFRTILHNLTHDDHRAMLERCYEHLNPDGRLILNFFQPDPSYISAEFGEPSTDRFIIDDEDFILIDHSHFKDPVKQLVSMKKELISEERGTLQTETLTIRLIEKQTFELLLEKSPFEDWTVYGGFDKEELTDKNQELVWEIRKT